MTRLLVSVRDAREALDAIAGGADLIDIKEPHAGSLGAASPDVVRDIIKAVGASRPVSVALGELGEAAIGGLSHCAGATYAKVGLSRAARDPNWPRRWKLVIDQLPGGVRPVAVIYADHRECGAPGPSEVLVHARQFGCAAVLIDTFDKTRGRLCEQWSIGELCELAVCVREAKMLFVLAGSLAAADLSSLACVCADYLAVRSAVCESQRTGRLARGLVEKFSAEMKAQSAAMSSARKDTAEFA